MVEKVSGAHGHVGTVEVHVMNVVEQLVSNRSEVCCCTNVDCDSCCLKRLTVMVGVQRMMTGARKDR